jgi:hypothetical protein
MAIAIMGGLTVATLLTIFFVPALYAAWFKVSSGLASSGDAVMPLRRLPPRHEALMKRGQQSTERRCPVARRVEIGVAKRSESMSNTMKAAVVREFGKPLVIEEVPVPQPNENQILVRIAATGICHTDLHAATRRLARQAEDARSSRP